MAYNYEYPYTDPGLYNDDWLINKIKQLAAEWEDMKVKFTTLEEYVKNYFTNLDVQDEINNKIDSMIADGSFTDIVSGVVSNYQGGFPYARKGVIFVGGNFLFNSRYTSSGSQRISDIIASSNSMSPVTHLEASNLSLMTPGNSFYEVLKSWKDNNLDYYKQGYRFIFIFPEFSDYLYNYNSIVNALYSITAMFTDLTTIVVNIPFPNFKAPTDDQLTALHIFKLLKKFGGFKMYIPPTPLLTGKDMFNGDILTSEATLEISNMILSKLIWNNVYPPNEYPYTIEVDSSHIIFTIIEYNEKHVLCKIDVRWLTSAPRQYSMNNLPLYTPNCVITSSTGTSIFTIHLNQGRLDAYFEDGEFSTTIYSNIPIIQ